MKRVLVTGANKGIGFEIVKGLVRNGCFVFLGSRNLALGEEAMKSLEKSEQTMVHVVQLDVTDDVSVARAVETVHAKCDGQPLFGLINNAGGAAGEFGNPTAADFKQTIDLNFGGTVRTTKAFLPILAKDGRIVMTSSGAAPQFVAKLAKERQKMFLAVEENIELTLEQIIAFVEECISISARLGDNSPMRADTLLKAGLGDGDPYGLAKACINAYTILLARSHPSMLVNACSPGFIETDFVRSAFEKMGKSPSEFGALPVERGAVAPLYLMLDEGIPGSGWYFGSDTRRSPPHLYRNPGTAAYYGSGTFFEASVSQLFEKTGEQIGKSKL